MIEIKLQQNVPSLPQPSLHCHLNKIRNKLQRHSIANSLTHHLRVCRCEVVCDRCLSSTRTHRLMEWIVGEIDASQAERLGRSCLSIARSALSLARSAQAERDNESCFLCVQPAFIDL
ncbi:hypothetical protein EVAR_79205_1 [Eumeta japonica]|uniref:Uncharacterized protein n=1 Tax=Eumeta variegata TaxID=151549 RepID=A0A4C1UUJ6_EUMVA|nr:hypothetical protein EVAR_79205_1 [Eumeta japonica]